MKPPGPYLLVVPEPGDEDPELERYLAAARELSEPDAQRRASVARALNAALPPTAPLPAFGRNATSPAALGARWAWLHAPWLALGAVVIGGLGFGLGLTAGRSEPDPSPRVATPSIHDMTPANPADERAATPRATGAASVVDGATPPARDAELEVARAQDNPNDTHEATSARRAMPRAAPRSQRLTGPRARSAQASAAAGRSTEPGSSRSVDFRAALERLRRARQQLEQGHATASLLLLSELDRDAGELLVEEREATRVLALCAAGETPAARAAAERLQQRSPRSIYLRRLASSCIDDGATAPDADAPAP